ncbi:MAG: arylesterase [Desulfovermiculus sp.]|nr:arylesterase [Desulfovermiculus sp.]
MSTITLCAFGNSLTAGFGLPEAASMPRQLLQNLEADGYRVKIANHGLSGDTTAGGLTRIQTALRPRPDLVILELGINDILMGLPAHRIKRNLERLIQACLHARAQVLLAGFTAVPGIPQEEAEQFNALYPDLAQSYNLHLFPDFLEGVVGNPDLTLPDGLHPNVQGIASIVNRLTPLLERLLEIMRTGEKE